MKNFSVNVDGKTYWISRSIATAAFVFRHNHEKNELQILVEKRGKGAADYQGKYCCPCGYLDYNETLAECAKREVLEETGVELDVNKLIIFGINDKPSENHQNVTVRFTYLDKSGKLEIDPSKAIGGEKDEVESVEWLTVAVYDPEEEKFCFQFEKELFKDEIWAFNHNRIIHDYLLEIFRKV